MQVIGDLAKSYFGVTVEFYVYGAVLRETKRTDTGDSMSRKLFGVNFVEVGGESKSSGSWRRFCVPERIF